MGFSRPQLVVVSGLFLHDGIQAITKPFTNFFLSFMMELWLSRSLSHELFFFHDGILAITKPFSRTFLFLSRWNSGYHEAFLTNFLFFSRWNSGYHEAFLTNFSLSFTMEFWLSQSLSHELSFFFHDGILAITKPFSRTFLFLS
jgi:hypothetical protein